MLFADRLTLDAPRRTRDGYMVTRAKAARAGIYEYAGREVDPEGKRFAADQMVKVWRPEEEVFAKDSVASFLMKPITNDHPAQPVTADNWKTYAKGVVGKALREGDFLAFDLVLMDGDLIRDVESGKRELSNGYASELIFEDGTTDAGEPYDAIQRTIRGNHVAVVDKGRAGPFCRIQDAAHCDAAAADFVLEWLTDGETYSAAKLRDKNGSDTGEGPKTLGAAEMATKQITVDGMPIEVTDQAEAMIRKLERQLTDAATAKGDLETQVATLTTDKATLEAKVTTLEQQLKDAALSPADLRDAAKSYALTADKAKALGVTVTDVMGEADIMKAAVTARMGDAAKDWNDAQVAASFASLTLDAKADPVRQVIRDGAAIVIDTAQIRDAARDSRYAPVTA